MTSNVSTVSSSVAKGHQVMPYVSCSPSKIPYVEFSPVRLQIGIRRRPSSDYSRLIRRQKILSQVPLASSAIHRDSLTYQSDPETLGSSAGYVVPPTLRLLWSHPRLSSSPFGLFSSSEGSFPIPSGERRASPLYSACLYLRAASRTPVDPAFALDCSFNTGTGFRPISKGSTSTSPARRFSRGSVTRLQSSLYVTARRFACPSPTRTFTFKLSSSESLHYDVE